MVCSVLLVSALLPGHRLQMRLWRAARMVIDASVHSGGMSQEQAVEFLVKEIAFGPVNSRAEVARYIDDPTRPMSCLLAFGPVALPAIAKGMGL